MDDPGWSWPAWKFGLKRSDLSGTLHDQYNTFTFTIQDPEAFHADVYEISQEANTTDEFHRLMSDRRRQRLQELNESLESLAVEIIANPKLMDSEHWTYALQLFRTKSFDSLVRYFASYLPEGYLGRSESRSGSVSSAFSDAASVNTASTNASSVDDAPAQYFTFTDGPVMSEEPGKMDKEEVHAPLSPPTSEAMESAASPSSSTGYDARSHESSNPPSRSMSFSGSESGPFVSGFCGSLLDHNDDDASSSQSDDGDTAVSSVSDCAESHSSIDSIDSIVNDEKHATPSFMDDEVDDDEYLTAQFPEDSFDAVGIDVETPSVEQDDTPTPRQNAIMTSYIELKSTSYRRLPSPYRRTPSPSPRSHRTIGTPPRDIRRSPDEVHSKIQKSSPDPTRKRIWGKI